MDDDIRQILESWAHAEKWDECFESYRSGVEMLFNLNYPAITRQIEFLRNKQGAGETPLKFLERVTLESETCDLDNISKQQLTTLVLLNGMLDEKVTAAVLKDKSLGESGYKIDEVRRKIHDLESQKKKVESFANNSVKIPSIAAVHSPYQETLQTE